MKAHGKVNLCLLVGAPRTDGLHPIVSVFQPTALADEVTIGPATPADIVAIARAEAARARGDGTGAAMGGGGAAMGGGVPAMGGGGAAMGGGGAAAARGDAGAIGAAVTGDDAAPARDRVVCPGVDGDNLALRALAEFRRATGWDGPPQRVTIAKRIPIAAGMAGGSADAAAALRLVSQVSGLPIPDGLAMRLGADVPAMVEAWRALVTGAGEQVEPIAGAKPGLVIVPLDAALGAGEVYRAFDVLGLARSDAELAEAAERLRAGAEPPPVNDLEPAARRLCGAIDPALEALAEAGAEHPMVTGSGPTVFGRADDPERVVAHLRAAGYHRSTAA